MLCLFPGCDLPAATRSDASWPSCDGSAGRHGRALRRTHGPRWLAWAAELTREHFHGWGEWALFEIGIGLSREGVSIEHFQCLPVFSVLCDPETGEPSGLIRESGRDVAEDLFLRSRLADSPGWATPGSAVFDPLNDAEPVDEDPGAYRRGASEQERLGDVLERVVGIADPEDAEPYGFGFGTEPKDYPDTPTGRALTPSRRDALADVLGWPTPEDVDRWTAKASADGIDFGTILARTRAAAEDLLHRATEEAEHLAALRARREEAERLWSGSE